MTKEERNRKIEQIQSDIEQIQKDLNWVVNYLTSRHEPVPTPPYVQPTNIYSSDCTRCGINLSGVMGYVCTDRYCPTFMQVTSQKTSATLLNETLGLKK